MCVWNEVRVNKQQQIFHFKRLLLSKRRNRLIKTGTKRSREKACVLHHHPQSHISSLWRAALWEKNYITAKALCPERESHEAPETVYWGGSERGEGVRPPATAPCSKGTWAAHEKKTSARRGHVSVATARHRNTVDSAPSDEGLSGAIRT